jgi:hypothetical protein
VDAELMAKSAQGKGSVWFPANTAGMDDRIWQGEGASSDTDGVLFTRRGEVIKQPGADGYVKWDDPTGPFVSARPWSLGVYVRDSVSELVMSRGGKVSVLRGNDVYDIATGRQSAQSPMEADRFHQVNEILLICNGRDPNLKWDGRKTTPVGIAHAPPAPAVYRLQDQSTTQGNGMFSGGSIRRTATDFDYQFAYTWVNERGQESELSPLSEVVSDDDLSTGDRYGFFVVCDGEAPSDDIVAKNIYRTVDGGATLQLLRRVPGVLSTHYWSGEEPGSEGNVFSGAAGTYTPPAISDWCFGFRGRVYYKPAGDVSLIEYSEVNEPERVPVRNVLEVGPGGGGRVTGWATGQDFAVVFKDRSVYMLTHDKDGNPLLRPVSDSAGAVNDLAIASFEGRVYFLGEQGFFVFDGARVRPLSDQINGMVALLPRAHLDRSFAWLDRLERRVMLAVAAGPDETVNELWAIHIDSGAVTRSTGWDLSSAVEYEGEVIVGATYTDSGSDYNDLALYGASDEAFGENNNGLWRTRWMFLSDPDADKTFTRVDIHYVQSGDFTVQVEWFLDWDERTRINTKTFKTRDPDFASSLWNSGNWDEGTWDEQRARIKRIDLDRPEGTGAQAAPDRVTGKALQLRIGTVAKNTPWRMVGFRLYYESHGQRQEGTDVEAES